MIYFNILIKEYRSYNFTSNYLVWWEISYVMPPPLSLVSLLLGTTSVDSKNRSIPVIMIQFNHSNPLHQGLWTLSGVYNQVLTNTTKKHVLNRWFYFILFIYLFFSLAVSKITSIGHLRTAPHLVTATTDWPIPVLSRPIVVKMPV